MLLQWKEKKYAKEGGGSNKTGEQKSGREDGGWKTGEQSKSKETGKQAKKVRKVAQRPSLLGKIPSRGLNELEKKTTKEMPRRE